MSENPSGTRDVWELLGPVSYVVVDSLSKFRPYLNSSDTSDFQIMLCQETTAILHARGVCQEGGRRPVAEVVLDFSKVTAEDAEFVAGRAEELCPGSRMAAVVRAMMTPPPRV